MIVNGAAYIGSGPRTTPEAVIAISNQLQIPTYLVEIPKTGNWNHDMEVMHLDTFYMQLTDSKVVGCKDVLSRCKISSLQTGASQNFLKYLEERYEVLDTPSEEQKNYAANILVVSPGKVVIPSDYNKRTNKILMQHGISLVNAGLKELTQGFGATHCMCLQLVKYKDRK